MQTIWVINVVDGQLSGRGWVATTLQLVNKQFTPYFSIFSILIYLKANSQLQHCKEEKLQIEDNIYKI